MRFLAVTATEAGSPGHSNEDHALVNAESGVAVLVDGATARTATGCSHGTAWYAETLARHVVDRARTAATLRGALADAIDATAADHPACDLTHPGSPSATVGLVRAGVHGAAEWLVLGDITLLIDTGETVHVHTQSVDHIGQAERDAATALPIGSPGRDALLRQMKQVMHAHRNVEGGYWVAAADRSAATHAATGTLPAAAVRRLLLASDGAFALADVYGQTDPAGLLDLAQTEGPAAIITRVRAIEAIDPTATVFPRTKRGDDATLVYMAAGT